MNLNPRLPLILLAALAALLVAGCGEDEPEPLSQEEYTAKLQEILAPLATELQDIGAATSAGSTNQDAIDGVTEASDSLQRGIDELNAIEAPATAEDANQALIASLESFRNAADTFAETDPEDEQALQAAATELQSSVMSFQEDFQDAIVQLEEAGIEPRGAPTN